MKFSEYMKREMGKQMDAQMEIVRRWENTKDKKENQLTDWAKRLQENEKRQEKEKIEIETAWEMITKKRTELEREMDKWIKQKMEWNEEHEDNIGWLEEEKDRLEEEVHKVLDERRRLDENLAALERWKEERQSMRQALIALGITSAVGWGIILVKLIAEIIKIYA